jgi:hypothetical protein
MGLNESAISNSILQPRRVLVDGRSELIRESIDGRPLYQYRISAKKLDALESELSKPKCTDAARVLILAPLAAGRFAENYDGGAPSWADCGREVSKLYRPGDTRFKQLMAESLKHYKIEAISRDDNVLLLETIIRESGLPSPMLAAGRPLRRLLDALMDRAARGEDVIETAANLIGTESRLPQRYKDAGHLPQLCADLVIAVDSLKQDSGWNGGSLDSIWTIPSWDRKLPFRVPEEKAKEIVGCLLHVAEIAAESTPLSVERFLYRASGNWQLRARVAFPPSGHEIEQPNLPEVLTVRYAVDGEPTDEACRIRRQGGERLFRLARAANDLSELLASSARTLSLLLENPGGAQEPLDCQGGERLAAELPWIFRFRGDGKHVYLDSGERRSRAPELLVATLPGTEVTGCAALEPGTLDVSTRDGEPPQQRAVWRVKGVAELRWQGGEARIEAGYTGPDVHLQFSGRAANVYVNGCTGAYIGDPKPRRVGGLFGRSQWRPAGSSEWKTGVVRSVGKVTYRLIDDAGAELAKRNVFIFPDTFGWKVLHKQVELTLGQGFSVIGPASRVGDKWIIEFGTDSQIVVRIEAPGGEINLRFVKPRLTSFLNVATGDQFDRRNHSISARIIGAIVAQSNQHDHILVRRQSNAWNDTHPFPLLDNQLRLSEIKPFLNALAFDSRGRTHALRIEFPNHAKLEVEAYRISRNGDQVSISGASEAMNIELLELVTKTDETPASVILQRLDQESWVIPPLREGCLYLAMDGSHQAAPCLVKGPTSSDELDLRTFAGCVAISEEGERSRCLSELFQKITTQPGDGFNSGQIDECLDWLGRFQHVLTWLDPFLVLAANPVLAVKLLALARFRNQTQAQQGLRWGLDEVPLFWHRLTALDGAGVAEWANVEFGAEAPDAVRDLLQELPLQAVLHELSNAELPRLQAVYGAWRDQWQIRVQQWSDLSRGRAGTRSKEIGDVATSLWSNLAEAHELQSLLETRCQQVPDSIVDIHRSYLWAPFELALCVAYQLDISPLLRDDLIYARYAVSPEAFDDAFCVAIVLMERMK